MLKFTKQDNTKIVIQVRHATNHIAASFVFEFKDNIALHDILQRIVANSLSQGIMTCENLEFPFEINGINFKLKNK